MAVAGDEGGGGRRFLEHELPMTRDPEALLPGSACLSPGRLWSAALTGGESVLSPAERQHLQACRRCQAHFARIRKAAGAAPPEPQPPTVEVSALGHGDVTTLAEAVRRLPPGGRVLVRPGRYREQMVLDKPLEVVGVGPREAVVVEAERGPSLVVTAERGRVRGLSFRGGRPAAVEVRGGGVIFEECVVSGGVLAAVWVRGPGAAPALLRCRVHAGRTGVLFHDGARGRLEDSEVFANASVGVEITLGADPSLLRCAVRDNGRVGVLVSDGGKGSLEGCVISGHPGADVAVCFEGSPSLRRSWLRDGAGDGVTVRDRGAAALIGCQILDHGGAGVDVGAGCGAALRGCRVIGNKGGAVLRGDDARADVEGCEIDAPGLGAAAR